MKISIPGDNKILKQSNSSSVLGNIVESFNLDLRADIGKIRVSKAKKIDDFTASFSTTQQIIAIGQNNGIPFFWGVDGAVDGFYIGDGSTFASSSFTRDSSSVTMAVGSSDFCINNGYAYATTGTKVYYTATSNFSNWTEISSPSLTTATPHLLATLGNRTYVTNLAYKIATVSSSNVLSLTGTGTLDLALPGYTITALMSGLDRVWVGLSSLQQGQLGTTYVFEWDGETENTTSQRYEIDASGIICGVVKDGVPYILDTRGRLMVYVGSRFEEVARLPYKEDEIMYGFNTNQLNNRAIHPRAITVDGDEILINVSNMLHGSTSTEKHFADFPSGVWAYNKDNGLYHKYSASTQPYSSLSYQDLTDYGQMQVAQAGAIFVHEPIVSFNDDGEGGRVIFSQRYFIGADNDTETDDVDVTYKTAIFASDTSDNSQKWGYFITPEIHSQNVLETWQNIYPTYKKLLDTTDKIVVKYRTEKDSKTTATISWSNEQTMITSTDVSGYSEGDEVQFIQGVGSGKSAHIKSINPLGSGYSITIDESIGVGEGTSIAQFSKWIKAGEVTYSDEQQYKELTLPTKNKSPMVQFKVCMQFTGEDELYGITCKSEPAIKL